MVFVFDLDDTLYNQQISFGKAINELFPQANEQLSQLFVCFRKRADEVFEDSENGIITMEQMYVYRISKALEDIGMIIDSQKALQFQKRYTYYQYHIQLSEPIEELLQWLKNRVEIVLMTNGPYNHQMNKIHQLGLEKYFDDNHVFVSAKVGYMKPDERYYQYVESALGLKGEDCYYIGDNINTDILGAINSGWKSIWYNHRNKPNTIGKIPDIEVNSEQQLIGLLKEMVK